MGFVPCCLVEAGLKRSGAGIISRSRWSFSASRLEPTLAGPQSKLDAKNEFTNIGDCFI